MAEDPSQTPRYFEVPYLDPDSGLSLFVSRTPIPKEVEQIVAGVNKAADGNNASAGDVKLLSHGKREATAVGRLRVEIRALQSINRQGWFSQSFRVASQEEAESSLRSDTAGWSIVRAKLVAQLKRNPKRYFLKPSKAWSIGSFPSTFIWKGKCSECNGFREKDCSRCFNGRVKCGVCGGSKQISKRCEVFGCNNGFISVQRTRQVRRNGRYETEYYTERKPCTCWPRNRWTETCTACDPHGNVQCPKCRGSGKISCRACSGTGELDYVLSATITAEPSRSFAAVPGSPKELERALEDKSFLLKQTTIGPFSISETPDVELSTRITTRCTSANLLIKSVRTSQHLMGNVTLKRVPSHFLDQLLAAPAREVLSSLSQNRTNDAVQECNQHRVFAAILDHVTNNQWTTLGSIQKSFGEMVSIPFLESIREPLIEKFKKTGIPPQKQTWIVGSIAAVCLMIALTSQHPRNWFLDLSANAGTAPSLTTIYGLYVLLAFTIILIVAKIRGRRAVVREFGLNKARAPRATQLAVAGGALMVCVAFVCTFFA